MSISHRQDFENADFENLNANFAAHWKRVVAKYGQNDYVIIIENPDSEILKDIERKIESSRILRVIFGLRQNLDSEILEILRDFARFCEKKCVKVELCLQVQNLDSEISHLEKLCECKNVVIFAFKSLTKGV